MTITEQFLQGKKNDPTLCEDGILVSDDFIAVLDGVTSKGKPLPDGRTGGRAAMKRALEAVRNLPAKIDAFDAMQRLNEAVGALYHGFDGHAAVCAIIFSAAKKEIWSCGDCQCLINGQFFSHEKEIDCIMSQVRSVVLECARLSGMSEKELLETDPGREYIAPLLKKQRLFENSDSRFGYSVLNGKDFDPKKTEIHKVKTGDRIVLASDGYPRLCETLFESEKELQKTLSENPLCDGDYRSTKGLQGKNCSFDDRAYVRFVVNE